MVIYAPWRRETSVAVVAGKVVLLPQCTMSGLEFMPRWLSLYSANGVVEATVMAVVAQIAKLSAFGPSFLDVGADNQ